MENSINFLYIFFLKPSLRYSDEWSHVTRRRRRRRSLDDHVVQERDGGKFDGWEETEDVGRQELIRFNVVIQ